MIVGGVAVRVEMNVAVVVVGFDPAFSAERLPETPDRVGQAEGHERPGCEIASAALDSLDPRHRDAEGHPDATEEDRGCHVTETADGGHDEGAGHGPRARPGENDEREIVVRTEESVEECDAGRRRPERSD